MTKHTRLRSAPVAPRTRSSNPQNGPLQHIAGQSGTAQRLAAFQLMADRSSTVQQLQADIRPMQRMEEDELQGKFIQRMEEDELQGKFIQRMEEDELQGKFIQRMEEDELQGKFIQRMEEDELQGKFIQRAAEPAPKTNNTGLPDSLKSGIENLSGMSMDHVKVHRNSDRPAQVQAHAYAQGSEIHLAPGQEKHLPHEAWHVVQQAQGRVKPTMQMKGIAVNDDAGLEKEADVMGAKALQLQTSSQQALIGPAQRRSDTALVQRAVVGGKLNMVGELHPESNPRRGREKAYVATKGFGPNEYFTENEYKYSVESFLLRLLGKKVGVKTTVFFGDPAILRVEKRIGDTKEKLLPIVADFSADQLPKEFAVSKSIEVAWNAFTKHGVVKELQQIRLTMHELLKVNSEKEYAGKLLKLYEFIDKKEKDFDSREPVLDVATDAAEFIVFWSKIERQFSTSVKGGKPLAKVDDVDKARSGKMDEAAKTSAATPGVWKVGQSHIDDIKGADDFDAGALPYQIVTRGEFNAGFEAHEQHQHDKRGGLVVIPGEDVRDIPVDDRGDHRGVAEEKNLYH